MKASDISKQIVAYERRLKILRLRLSGASYPLIARTLAGEYGLENLPRNWGPLYVANDLKRLFAQMRNETAEEVAAARDLELMRLDEIYKTLHAALEGGDTSVVEKMLQVIKLRSQLLGLFPRTSETLTDGRPGLRIIVETTG